MMEPHDWVHDLVVWAGEHPFAAILYVVVVWALGRLLRDVVGWAIRRL